MYYVLNGKTELFSVLTVANTNVDSGFHVRGNSLSFQEVSAEHIISQSGLSVIMH